MVDLEPDEGTRKLVGKTADSSFDYSAFATHATDPDGALVREVEKLIEGYHLRPDLPKKYIRPLELCVDGRDFVFPRRSRDASGGSGAIETIVRAYQRRCRALLVFAGPQSRDHRWINEEIRWWDEERPDGPIYLVLTHGHDPADLDALSPPALIERGGADNEIFFDLRGFYAHSRPGGRLWKSFPQRMLRRRSLQSTAGEWRSVRPFREEISKLAARLVSDITGGELAVSDLETAYAEADRRARRRTMALGAAAGAAIIGASGAAIYAGIAYLAEARERQAVAWIRQADVLNQQLGPGLTDALASAASALLHSDNPRAKETLLQTAQKLAPIKQRLSPSTESRLSEQTQVMRLFDTARFLAIGGRDGILHVMSVDKETQSVSKPLDIGRIRSIEFDPRRRLLVVGGDKGLRAVGLGEPLQLDMVGVALESKRISGVALDLERGQVLAGSFDGEIYALPLNFSLENWPVQYLTRIMDPRYLAKGWNDVPSSVFGLRLTRQGLVAAGIDGLLTVFDFDGAKLSQRWQRMHPESIFSMDATPGDRWIAVADQGGGLTLYDPSSGTSRRLPEEAGPAAVAPDASGRWSKSSPERVSNVGVSFDPSGTVLGLAGFDRTARFFLSDTLVPIGAVVHEAATRAIAFDPDGTAFTSGDDGVIYQSAPLDLQDFPRRAGVIGVAPLSGRAELLFWSRAGDREGEESPSYDVYTFRPDDNAVESIMTTDADLRLATAASFGRAIAIRPALTTNVLLVAPAGEGSACTDGRIAHPNEPDNVQIVRRVEPGPRPGELTTFAVPANGGEAFARVFGADDCRPRHVMKFKGSPEQAAVAPGAIVVVDSLRHVRSILPDGQPTRIDFDEDIADLAVAQNAEVLAALTASGSICLCQNKTSSRQGSKAVCHARSETHSCRDIDASALATAARPTKINLNVTGEILIAASSRGGISVASDQTGWGLRPVTPAQLAPRDAPIAFSGDGSRIAAPAGQTGAVVLDASTLVPVAYVPTPSRVSQITFLDDGSNRLVTVDAGVLRIWRYERKELLAIACRRWPVGASSDFTGSSAPLERSEICGPTVNAGEPE